jgi:hypothetical protein
MPIYASRRQRIGGGWVSHLRAKLRPEHGVVAVLGLARRLRAVALKSPTSPANRPDGKIRR